MRGGRPRWVSYQATYVDATGSAKELEVTKAELLSLNEDKIRLRDLNSLGLDIPFRLRHQNRLPPCILPRGDCILMLMGPFKAVITRKQAFFFGVERQSVRSSLERLVVLLRSVYIEDGEDGGAGEAISDKFPSDLLAEKKKAGNERPAFELVVVEHVLNELCEAYVRRVNLFQPVVSGLLLDLTSNQSSSSLDKIHRLIPIKNGIDNFAMVTEEAATCINELLKSDEDMVGLLLTERHHHILRRRKEAKQSHEAEKAVQSWNQTAQLATGKILEDSMQETDGALPRASKFDEENYKLDLSYHTRVELLLENYLRRLVLTQQQTKYLRQQVQSAQVHVAIHVIHPSISLPRSCHT